jgi:hypothetical protein
MARSPLKEYETGCLGLKHRWKAGHERIVAIGISDSRRVGTIARHECDRRAAGAGGGAAAPKVMNTQGHRLDNPTTTDWCGRYGVVSAFRARHVSSVSAMKTVARSRSAPLD